MGIYGHAFDKLNIGYDLIMEMEADTDFIEFLSEYKEILKEDLQASVTLQDGKTKVMIIVRDKITITSSGGCSHIDSPSLKIKGPGSIVNKYGMTDIIIPGYDPTKSKEELKPYVDKKVLDKVKGENIPKEIELALKFAEEEQKLLRLIYQNPDTPNQQKLFDQMMKDSKYVINFKHNINSHKKK